jgi:GNAT superfamily N-acetyltransferase
MNPAHDTRPPDPFGDDEDILDISCRPAVPGDFPQVAFLAVGLLENMFGTTIGHGGSEALDTVQSALKKRLRIDSTWVMTEGKTIIGMIDIETLETRKLNGHPIARILSDALGYSEKVGEAGLLPLLVYEPKPDEAHQSLVALLPGSRGEGRGTLLLMHGAFWAKAQGKNWMTTWLPADEPARQVYEHRGYYVDDELTVENPDGKQTWVLLRKPISSPAHKSLRQMKKESD